jgi:hypothetical protein
MGVNREYKSSVFSFLFKEPEAVRELYEALEGVKLPPDTQIIIKTLEGVLYRTLLNDLAFLIGGKLVVLIEHQASINPNMAVRLLMYIARIYEKLTAGKSLYSKKKQTIPRPEFIVLYNGTEAYPDEAELRLSEAFEDAGILGLPAERPAELELRVKVYNINKGRNEGIVRRSERLAGYSMLIGKIREYLEETANERKGKGLSEGERDEAVGKAIKWCIAHDILKTFLEAHGTEVANMLYDEWKLEDALVVEREEGREEGLEEVAKNALAKGLPVELIREITGLDSATIQGLTAGP